MGKYGWNVETRLTGLEDEICRSTVKYFGRCFKRAEAKVGGGPA